MNEGRGQKELDYYFMPPAELPKGYLDVIISLVEAGGSVKSPWIRHNLERAFLIGYVKDGDEIIGCSSLKHPRDEYVLSVKEQCGIDLSGYLERGYTSVKPEYRGMGIASKLLAGLTERRDGRRIYSVIGEENIGGQKIALNNNTKKIAVYKSRLTGKRVGIWMPAWMVDD